MYCDCKYDKVKDVSSVDQFGFIDLAECLLNGEVPSTVADSEDQYNGIEDPGEIFGKPSDVFEAYKMGDYIKESGSVKKTASVEQK